jgi:hypothetical protein
MATAPTTYPPHRSIDAQGRALPMSDAEIRSRAQVAIKALEQIADDVDENDTEEMCEAIERGIDEDRLSDRKRFR